MPKRQNWAQREEIVFNFLFRKRFETMDQPECEIQLIDCWDAIDTSPRHAVTILQKLEAHGVCKVTYDQFALFATFEYSTEFTAFCQSLAIKRQAYGPSNYLSDMQQFIGRA
jgi:hypothetical protein